MEFAEDMVLDYGAFIGEAIQRKPSIGAFLGLELDSYRSRPRPTTNLAPDRAFPEGRGCPLHSVLGPALPTAGL